ncbi:MAG: MoaD/ThiS family protein [Bacillota bacterium]|nr:MoaD/ThiS family protein [Bacillota bacterium]
MKVMIHRVAIAENLPPHFEFKLEDNATFHDLVVRLNDEYGEGTSEKILSGDKLREGVLVLVNGKSLLQLGGPELILNDGDDIMLAVTVFGG